jgi:penicillin-binding protein 2
MTLTKLQSRPFNFAIIFFVLLILPLQSTVFGKKRQAAKSRAATRNEKSKKTTARDRKSNKRSERLSARDRRHPARTKLSRREARRDRKQSAREQANAIAALQRRLRRPLTKRERAAELRRLNSSRRRELLEARRRAEAARRAAIARQLALEKAMRDEAMSFITKDDTTGEDPEVRRVAVNALGYHAGTVVVMDPMTGRVYSVVNQEWALRRGFKPCSTIKLVTGVAGLQENMISPYEGTTVSDRYRLDLTDALAYSNNTYFQHIGGQVGFDKMIGYAKEMGLGEKTGINVNYEYPGRLPAEKTGFALNRMSSHGDDFEVTPLQLGTLVSSMANGGKLMTPFIPRTAQDTKVKVRRQLDISQDNLRRMVPGMVGAVNYGSGKKAYDPLQTVAGKTGTCIQQGAWVGLFTSYAPLANPRLAVVVIARGSDGRKHFPAAVAGRIYRDLNQRFGTPVHLQIAGKPTDDSKAAELNEEEKDAVEAEQAETEAAIQEEEQKAAVTATTPEAPAQHPLVTQPPPTNSTVKRVMLPVDTRNNQIQKTDSQKANKTSTQPDNRLRRTQP